MMVLRQVLHEIESAVGPMDLDALSRKLEVERSALQGMIEYWVRKGRLREDFLACASTGCGASCPGAQSCVLVTQLPRTFAIRTSTDQAGLSES